MTVHHIHKVHPLPADRSTMVAGLVYDLDADYSGSPSSIVTVEYVTVRDCWVFVGGFNQRGHYVSADLHQHKS